MKKSYEFDQLSSDLDAEGLKKEDSPLETEKAFQRERAAFLSKHLTPELRTEYVNIASTLKAEAKKGLIEIESLEDKIEPWTEKLIASLHASENDFTEEDEHEIRAEVWNFFTAVARVTNTDTLMSELDQKFTKQRLKERSSIDRSILLEQSAQGLTEKYNLTPDEASALAEIVAANSHEVKIDVVAIAKAISKLWKEYDVGDQKKELGKIALGRILSSGINAFAPYVFKDLIKDGEFNVSVFIENFFLSRGANLVDGLTEISVTRFESELSQKIVSRASEVYFYGQFDPAKSISVAEMQNTVSRGTRAATNLVKYATSELLPMVTGTSAALVFLTQIHPALAGITLSGLPLIYYIGKKNQRASRKLDLKRRELSDAIDARTMHVLNAAEDIKTAPRKELAVEELKSAYKAGTELDVKMQVQQFTQSIKENLPRNATELMTLGVGSAFVKMGLIPPGAILTNMMYARQLEQPISSFFHHERRLTAQLDDVAQMELLLGPWEDLDLPNSENEKRRVGASSIKDTTITIEKLSMGSIFNDVSLVVEKGSFTVLAGPSGAGKTTLLRTIVGLLKQEKGTVKIGNTATTDIKRYGGDSVHSIMGYAKQKPDIFPDKNLRDNLSLWGSEDVNDEKIKQALEAVQLGALASKLDERVNYLSGGETVRLGLARVLLRQPKILLLDEPTASLDPEAAAEIISVIKEMHKANPDMTILCVSHDGQVKASADRVVELAGSGTGTSSPKE